MNKMLFAGIVVSIATGLHGCSKQEDPQPEVPITPEQVRQNQYQNAPATTIPRRSNFEASKTDRSQVVRIEDADAVCYTYSHGISCIPKQNGPATSGEPAADTN